LKIDQLKQEKIDAGEPVDEAFFAALYGEIDQQMLEVGDVGPMPGTLVDFADGKRKRGRPRKYPRAPDGVRSLPMYLHFGKPGQVMNINDGVFHAIDNFGVTGPQE
jgi:hypothetical protein